MNLSGPHKIAILLFGLLIGPVMFYISPAFAENLPKVTVTYDDFMKSTNIEVGDFNIMEDKEYGISATSVKLRGFVIRPDNEVQQLYVHYEFPGVYVYISSAVDSDGKDLPFQAIDRLRLGHGRRSETFGVSLDRAYLEAHRASGLNVKFFGRRGNLEVKLQAAYVEAFLESFDLADAKVTVISEVEKLQAEIKKAQAGHPDETKLGIVYLPVDAAIAKVYGIDATKGVMVAYVAGGSAAEHSGIKGGDIILTLNGAALPNVKAGVQQALARYHPGDQAALTIWRGGKATDVAVTF